MTEEQLKAIKERADNATPGPWYSVPSTFDNPAQICVFKDGDYSIEITDDLDDLDAEFIAQARNDVPALIAEVERLHEALSDIANHNIFRTPQIHVRDYAQEVLNPKPVRSPEQNETIDRVIANIKKLVQENQVNNTSANDVIVLKNTIEEMGNKFGELNVFLQERTTDGWGEHVVDVAIGHIEKTEAENMRLREALETIANKRDVDFGNSYANAAYMHSIKTARKALNGDSND